MKLVKAKNRILLMTHPSSGKTTFWRDIGGQDNGSHWGNVKESYKSKPWQGQSLEERNERRGSAIVSQGYYNKCHVLDQPYSGAGDRSSQERLIKMGFVLRTKSKINEDPKTGFALVCRNGEVTIKNPKKESICYMGGQFHRKDPEKYFQYVNFVAVVKSDEVIERNCWERLERGKYTIKERRWGDVERVREYRDKLVEYCDKNNIAMFEDFKEALDSIL